MSQSPIFIIRSVLVILLIFGSIPLYSAETVSRNDPLEGMNRTIFSFNHFIDTYALKPVARGYDFVTPKPVQNLVSNFFNNLGETRNVANAVLQLKGGDFFTSLSRFIVNSTMGMLGLVDVATPIGLEQKYNDFGMTFAHWGIPSGPYIVLPLFGPSTPRASIGMIPNYYTHALTYHDPERQRWIAQGVNLVNTRTQLLSAEELIIGDRYTFIRDSYLQRRNFLITGEQPEDDF